jgi:hypothetical protein
MWSRLVDAKPSTGGVDRRPTEGVDPLSIIAALTGLQIAVAVLSGMVAAFITGNVCRAVGASKFEAIRCSGAAFVAITTLMILIMTFARL